MSVYKRIGALLPKRVVEYFGNELGYVGLDIEEKRFVGFVFSFSLALAFVLAFNLYIVFRFPFLESFLLILTLLIGGVYYWLGTMSESKGSFVEKILPDALQLIASNVKAGMTTERALFTSARPEFGPLSDELKNASKRISSGERMEVVLADIPNKIKSGVLARTIWLMTQGIKSGGQISELLLQLSDDLRLENSLKEEARANISMYVIMVFVAAGIGAPLLFAISSFIVNLLTAQTASLPISADEFQALSARSPVGGFIGVPKITITSDFIVLFSVMILFFTAIFASLIIGVINSGSERAGVKYAPMLLIVDFALFFLARAALTEVFSGAFGFLG